MAMFVLVVDTSLMNVSISKVVEDLDTTVSGVQSAIALEALVSAAFILIGSKVGDLIGRKRAFVLGLLGYAVGALAMAFAQGLTAIIVFWAIIGGLGASLLLPAMQSLIHGNFQGAAQKKAYALVGAAAAIAAAVGPLLGGFLTTFLSWRVGFLLEVVVIAVVLSGLGLHPRRALHRRPRTSTSSARCCRPSAWAASSSASSSGRRAASSSALLIAVGLVALGSLARWLVRRKRAGKPTLLDPDLFKLRPVPARDLVADAAEHRARRGDDRPADLPADGAGVQRAADRPDARAAVADDVRDGAARRQAGRQAPARRAIIRAGSGLLTVGHAAAPPDRPARGLRLGARHPADHRRGAASACWCPSSTTTRSRPISDERVSEAAGVNSAAGSFGLSFGLAVRRRDHARDALDRVHPDGRGQHRAAARRTSSRSPTRSRTTREVMSNTQLDEQLAGQPPEIQDEIIAINTDARPLALQVALLVPILAGLLGLLNGFRMMRRPDPAPSASVEAAAFGPKAPLDVSGRGGGGCSGRRSSQSSHSTPLSSQVGGHGHAEGGEEPMRRRSRPRCRSGAAGRAPGP